VNLDFRNESMAKGYHAGRRFSNSHAGCCTEVIVTRLRNRVTSVLRMGRRSCCQASSAQGRTSKPK